MKTQEELNTLKQEYETLNSKLKELTDDELTQVAGGDANTIKTTYYLATDGNGSWEEYNTFVMTSIIVSGNTVPNPGKTITYKDLLNNERTVSAVANSGYTFQNCSFDSETNTFMATFSAQ